MIEIIRVESEAHISAIRELFREYATALGHDLGFQDFDRELAELPGRYGPPRGSLLLAFADDRAAGCVGLRPLSEDVCEMKRMYVRPAYRSGGFGQRLAREIIEQGRRLGYRRIRLDTLAEMRAANRLYESFGFTDIEPYYDNPLPGARYMELAILPGREYTSDGGT
jgi:putative acetyltransferase